MATNQHVLDDRACQSDCQKENGCKYFVYRKGTCWLKSGGSESNKYVDEIVQSGAAWCPKNHGKKFFRYSGVPI